MKSDAEYMMLAVEEARKCIPSSGAYSVGALIVCGKTGEILATGFSREIEGNTHAEECCFIKLENTKDIDYNNVILYTTMEPCSKRLSKKTSCTEHCIEKGIKKIVLGILEPENFVNCEGVNILKDKGIEIIEIKDEKVKKACKETNKHLLKVL